MTYEVHFSDTAYKQFKKLDNKLQIRIIDALERIRLRPESYVTKLIGDSGYRLRVGDYRLIVDIDNKKILILVIKIGHRKKIYK